MPSNPYDPPRASVGSSEEREPSPPRFGLLYSSPASYLIACTVAGAAPLLAVFGELALGRPSSSDALYGISGLVLLAALTYPAGMLGTLAAAVAIWFGALTPAEAALLSAPVSAAGGYLQWYVVVPRLRGRSS